MESAQRRVCTEAVLGECTESECARGVHRVGVHGECAWGVYVEHAQRVSVHGQCARGMHRGERAWGVCMGRTRTERAHAESMHGASVQAASVQAASVQAVSVPGSGALLAARAQAPAQPPQGDRRLPRPRPQPSRLSRGLARHAAGEATLTRPHAKGTCVRTWRSRSPGAAGRGAGAARCHSGCRRGDAGRGPCSPLGQGRAALPTFDVPSRASCPRY